MQAGREIILDTETTGLWVNQGHRLIEIACIELENSKPTGRLFHRYIYPKLSFMPASAFEIHGISIGFLRRFPPFEFVAEALLEFIGSASLIVHNASFDLGFVNAELSYAGRPPIAVPYVDTLGMARSKFPGAAASLDALCRRFDIDLSVRAKHGAMIDCGLLARVYFELTGGRQPDFVLPQSRLLGLDAEPGPAGPLRPPRMHPPLTAQEEANFAETLARIKEPIWNGAIGDLPPEPPPVRNYKGFELPDDEIPF